MQSMGTRFPVPFASPDDCYNFALRRAARALSRRYDDALAPVDLNNGQFSMLAMIAVLGPVRIQTLADELAMDRTTVTAALKPLIRRNLVQVAVSREDSRARDATLTRAGEALLARAIPLWQAQQREVASQLSESDANALRRQLARLTEFSDR